MEPRRMEMTGRVLVVIGVCGRAGLSGGRRGGIDDGEQYHKMGHRQHSKYYYYYYILHTPY